MKTTAFFFVAFLAVCSFFGPAVAQDNCDVCQTVITLVETWVESNATEQQIITYLDAICAAIPNYQAVCDQLVSQGIAQVISWIQNNETPLQVCTQLGMCSNSSKNAFGVKLIKETMVPADDQTCTTCEYIISTVEQWLENTNDQQDVINALETVCTYMPGWETTCDAIIAAGVPQVIEWIATNENSTVVCGQLGLCSSVQIPVVPKPEDNCDDCETLIGFIENWVEQNATESQIVTYLEGICALVPNYQVVCDTIVETEVPQIIKYIQQNQPPSVVCQELGLCSSKKIQNKPIKLNIF